MVPPPGAGGSAVILHTHTPTPTRTCTRTHTPACCTCCTCCSCCSSEPPPPHTNENAGPRTGANSLACSSLSSTYKPQARATLIQICRAYIRQCTLGAVPLPPPGIGSTMYTHGVSHACCCVTMHHRPRYNASDSTTTPPTSTTPPPPNANTNNNNFDSAPRVVESAVPRTPHAPARTCTAVSAARRPRAMRSVKDGAHRPAGVNK